MPIMRPEDWARAQVAEERLPVAVIGSSDASGIRSVASFGTDDGKRVTEASEFAIFSVTKPLVALAAMRLVEGGTIDIDTELPAEARENRSSAPVTLANLLSHTSGIHDVLLDSPHLDEELKKAPELFAAGTAVQYCNLGFVGVRAIIERCGHADFETLISDVTGGGRRTPVGFEPRERPVTVHGLDAAGIDYSVFRTLRHPAAGLFANVGDLLAVGSELLRVIAGSDSSLIRPETLAAMRESRTVGRTHFAATTTDTREWGLGFGLAVAEGLPGGTRFGHGGLTGCQWWIYPDQRVCFTLMTNVASNVAGPDYNELHHLISAFSR